MKILNLIHLLDTKCIVESYVSIFSPFYLFDKTTFFALDENVRTRWAPKLLLTNRKNVEVVWCCSKIMLLLRKVRVIHDYAEENMRRYLSLYDTFTQRKIFSCDQECRVIPLSKIFYSLDLGSFDFILENLKTVKRF